MPVALGELKVGVVGAGVMGAGMAQSLAVAGAGSVTCVDLTEDRLASARSAIETGRFGIAAGVERGIVSESDANRALASLSFSSDRSAIADSDIVLEAVFEDLALKIRLFRELDREIHSEAIFASNTSGFSISALAAATDRADRFIGWHWASPAAVQRMAEIVRGAETSDQTVETIKDLATACGKNPVVVKDSMMVWGFVANRIFRAATQEAQQIVSEGLCDPAGVDQLMRDCFRWPAGPFELSGGARSNWSDNAR